MINSKFKVAAVLASIVIIFLIYYLYTPELIYDNVDDPPLSSQQVQACKAAVIENLEQFKKDARLSNSNPSNSTLLEWNQEFSDFQERFDQTLIDNRCINSTDGHLKSEWFTEEFKEYYQNLIEQK